MRLRIAFCTLRCLLRKRREDALATPKASQKVARRFANFR
jgi:hypothetical protein